MTAPTGVELRPIERDAVPRVAQFFHQHLNSRLSAAEWAASMIPSWNSPSAPHGHMLTVGDEVVGASLLFWAERELEGARTLSCNLAALCVRPEQRPHAVRLLRAALRRRDVHYTDLSPSGNVVELDRRLGFEALDTTTHLVPYLARRWPAGARLVTREDEVNALLDPHERQVFEDHRGSRAARHVVLVRGDEHCYVVYRRDRRKRLPIFASLLHVGNPRLLVEALPRLQAHLLVHEHAPLLLAERRLLGAHEPSWSATVAGRPKMFRSPSMRAEQVDYLYSELTCVAW